MKYYSLVICIGFILMWTWLLVPADKMLNPYPLLRKFTISAQFYYMYAGLFLMMSLIAGCVAKITDAADAWVIAILFFNLFLDYLLHYLQPYGYFTGISVVNYKPERGLFIPISYPLLMGLILIYLSWKWIF